MIDRPKLRTWLFLSLMLLGSSLVFSQLPASAAFPSAAAQESAPALDLPAMVLSPADLEEAGYEGFGVARVAGASSGWRSIGDVALDSVTANDVENPYDIDRLNAELAQTGWQRQYRRVLAQPSANDAEFANMAVFTAVAEFADESGAEAALTLLMNAGGVVPPGALPIGDRLEIRRFLAMNFDQRLALAFRDKNLLGFVEITEYSETEGPELEPAILLARHLHIRVRAEFEDPGPGLADAALHLATFASPAEFEGYWRLAGETPPLFGEDIIDSADRSDALGDAIDVYQFEQVLWPRPGQDVGPVYENRLYRFADASAASALLAGMPQRLAANAASSDGTFDAQVVEDAALIGDESVTFALKDLRWNIPTFGYRIYTRVGEYVARISFHSSDGTPLPLTETLAAAQAGCLSEGSCSGANQPPVRLSGFDCPPTSLGINGPPAALPPYVGAVPMTGSNPARTGMQPGPRPDGDPGAAWSLRAHGLGGRSLVVSDNLIAFQTKDSVYSLDVEAQMDAGDLYVLDDSGNFIWCIPTGAAYADPVFADGLVFTQSEPLIGNYVQRTVEALDAETGTAQWSASIGFSKSGNSGGLTAADGTVYATAGQGALYALDQSTGVTRWVFEVDATENIDWQRQELNLPAIADSVVYITSSHTLFALDSQSGSELWRFVAASEDELLGTPSVANGIVYVGGNQAVYAVDASGGQTLWQLPVVSDGGSRLAVADGVLYVSTGAETGVTTNGFLAAVDAASGAQIWKTDFAGYVTTPVIAGDVIYVGYGQRLADSYEEGAVFALFAKVGEPMWNIPLNGPATAPVVIGGYLFVTENSSSEGKARATVYAIGGSEWPVTVENDPQ